MTQFLPPNLLALFAPRDPIPYKPPLGQLTWEKDRTKSPYIGVGHYVHLFEDPKDTPPPTRGELKAEKKKRRIREKAEKRAEDIKEELAAWDPHNDPNANSDAFKTLFVGRINYDTSESKLRREFEVYGKIKKVHMVKNVATGKSRGYAFIEYEKERDMHAAYKSGDGKKIDGRRVLVDVERGRTVKGWKPRRLGGGLGSTRASAEDGDNRMSLERDRQGDNPRDYDRDRSRPSDRTSTRDRDRRERRDRDRDRGDRERERPRDRERDRGDRDKDRDRDRDKRRRDDRDRRDRDKDRDKERDRKRDDHKSSRNRDEKGVDGSGDGRREDRNRDGESRHRHGDRSRDKDRRERRRDRDDKDRDRSGRDRDVKQEAAYENENFSSKMEENPPESDNYRNEPIKNEEYDNSYYQQQDNSYGNNGYYEEQNNQDYNQENMDYQHNEGDQSKYQEFQQPTAANEEF